MKEFILFGQEERLRVCIEYFCLIKVLIAKKVLWKYFSTLLTEAFRPESSA
jgi:hypothetical protein